MPKRYILNANIAFSPEEHQLSACDSQDLAVRLNTPVSRCLELLIEHRYRLIPHDEFYTYVWGEEGSKVPANSLYQNIALLRKALKTFQAGGDKIVKTVRKQGFTLYPDVTVQELDEEIPATHQETPHNSVVPVDGTLEPHTPLTGRHTAFSNNKSVLFIGVGALLLLGLVVFQLKLWDMPLQDAYLSNFEGKESVLGCQVYTFAGKSNLDAVSALITDNRIDCLKRPYLYSSVSENGTHASLLSCERKLDDPFYPNCVSYNAFTEAKR